MSGGANLKRKFPTTDGWNAVSCGNLASNFDIVQDLQLLDYERVQRGDARPVNARCKRARPSDPHSLIVDSNSIRTNLIHSRNHTTSRFLPPSLAAPNAAIRFDFDPNIQEETGKGGFYDHLIDCLSPNVPTGAGEGGMSGSKSGTRSTNLRSNIERQRLPIIVGAEDSKFINANVLNCDKKVSGISSRRRQVPGENTPRLASSWRETTSSRGQDNPLGALSQKRTVAASRVGFLEYNSENDEVEVESYNALSRNLVSADERATTETQNQQTLQYEVDRSWADHSGHQNLEDESVFGFAINPVATSFPPSHEFSWTPMAVLPTFYSDFTIQPEPVNYDFALPDLHFNLPEIYPQHLSDGRREEPALPSPNLLTPSRVERTNFADYVGNVGEVSSASARVHHGSHTDGDWSMEDIYPAPSSTNTVVDRITHRNMLLGSAEFSMDPNLFPFLERNLQSSTDCGSNEITGSLNATTELTSESKKSTGINRSKSSGGSEHSEDASHWKQMPKDRSLKKRSRSFSHISAKFTSLNEGADSHAPVLIVVEDTNDTQQEVQDILAKANKQSNSNRKPSNSPTLKIATTWEHTFMVQAEFEEAAQELPRQNVSRKGSRRLGPLNSSSADRARKMRRLGSCMRCRISKIACTEDVICIPCQKATSSPIYGRVCSRDHLKDYANVFIPEQAVRAFQKASVTRLMKEKVGEFNGKRIEVSISSGPNYPPIRLTVREFKPRDLSFLVFKRLVYDDVSKVSSFKEAYSPPLGIYELNQDLSDELIGHIRRIIRGERNYGEVSHGNTSQLAWDVYNAIRLYQHANPKNQFLRNLLMLHAMQYFMTKSLTILRGSCEQALNSLQHPTQLEYAHNPNVRLINIQIKHLMLDLIRETYLIVLEELEKQLRPKEPALWAPTFCCILILSMCAEMVQITTDFRILNAMDNKLKSMSDQDEIRDVPSQDESVRVCRRLDDLPIASATGIFHFIYKTNKSKESQRRENSFNPIYDGLDAKATGLDESVEDFVNRIRDIMTMHGNNLDGLAAAPSFDSSSDPLTDHTIFRKRNSGRLVAKFLRSFR